MHALWVHNVLVANMGLALVRTVPYGVQRTIRSVASLDATAVKGLGDDPMWFVVVLDGGRELEVATARERASVAVGPFEASHT